MARDRKSAFKLKHPYCIFCGGEAPMTTIEHCPPRAMFQDREWPEGFEFPACSACNHGSADDDLIVAMMARINPFEGSAGGDGKFNDLIGSVHQQHPKLFEKMTPTAIEARRLNKKLGIKVVPGKTQQGMGVAKTPPEMHRAMEVFAAKLGKAIYYLDTGRVFPQHGELAMRCSGNSEIVAKGQYGLVNTLSELPGHTPLLKRGKRSINSQFEYKLSMSEKKDLFAIVATFGLGFAVVIFGSPRPGLIKNDLSLFREITGRVNQFTLLPASR